MIRNIAIIGVGVMGGSMALALRRSIPDLAITGFDQPGVLKKARQKGAITRSAYSLRDAVSDVDAVVLATPVEIALDLFLELTPLVRPGTWITDLGSVKVPIDSLARARSNPAYRFVGGHPMTGSEHTGIEYADELLFENATYVLCPSSGGPRDDFLSENAPLIELIQSTGARILVMEAERHDRIAARTSHLPQILSVLLVNAATGNCPDPETLSLAAGGFRDMTRIAGSSFSIWKEILTLNRDVLVDLLDSFAHDLQLVREDLLGGNLDYLEESFFRSTRSRAAIPKGSKGFLRPLAEVFVFVSDKPGAIHEIAGILGEHDLNIKDIELLKIREGTGGTFRLGFETEEKAEAAAQVLASEGFRMRRL